MAWIESHQEIFGHPKTSKLARLLGVSRPTVIGHLHMLWWWALDYAPSGILNNVDPEDIASAVEWQGDATKLWSALLDSRWVDRDTLYIHDWHNYAGKLLNRREKDAKRKSKERIGQHVQRTSEGSLTDGVRNSNSNHNTATATGAGDEVSSFPYPEEGDTFPENFYVAHKRLFGVYPTKTQTDVLDSYVVDGIEEAVVIRALETASRVGKGYSFRLIEKIMNDYVANKVKTLAEAIACDEAFVSGKSSSDQPENKGGRGNRYQQDMDELRRAKEELQREIDRSD